MDEVEEALVDDDVLCAFKFGVGGAATVLNVVLEYSYHFGYATWLLGGEVAIFVWVVV